MKHLFETSIKFPNNVVKTKPVAIPKNPTSPCFKVLYVKITSNSEIKIPLISLTAEKFGKIDLKFFGIPIEVRQKGKVRLYGIFKGDYLNERFVNQEPVELIGIPQREFLKAQFESNTDAYISPLFLGAPTRSL